MGQRISLANERVRQPDIAPVTDRPPTFDPLAGFPKGRKVRQMVATEEEMDAWNLPIEHRDYCAHKYINAKRCQYYYFPLANYMCRDDIHAWMECQYHDYLMRVKEFERERRLLMRMKRKRQAAERAKIWENAAA